VPALGAGVTVRLNRSRNTGTFETLFRLNRSRNTGTFETFAETP